MARTKNSPIDKAVRARKARGLRAAEDDFVMRKGKAVFKPDKNPSKKTIRRSRTSAVNSLPKKFTAKTKRNLLNFTDSGRKIGDFTLREVKRKTTTPSKIRRTAKPKKARKALNEASHRGAFNASLNTKGKRKTALRLSGATKGTLKSTKKKASLVRGKLSQLKGRTTALSSAAKSRARRNLAGTVMSARQKLKRKKK